MIPLAWDEIAALELGELLGGAPGVSYLREVDRRAAIPRAILDAGDDVVVLVAGKGHEDYQIYGDERRAFSDQKVVASTLATRVGGAA